MFRCSGTKDSDKNNCYGINQQDAELNKLTCKSSKGCYIITAKYTDKNGKKQESIERDCVTTANKGDLCLDGEVNSDKVKGCGTTCTGDFCNSAFTASINIALFAFFLFLF